MKQRTRKLWRALGAGLWIGAGLVGAQRAHGLENPSAFGWNHMRAVGSRPLLVILMKDPDTKRTAPAYAPFPDTTNFDALIFDPPQGAAPTRPNLAEYFREVSNGLLNWRRGGVVGPFSFSAAAMKDYMAVRNEAIRLADESGVDFALFDQDRNGIVTAQELGILVLDNYDGQGGNSENGPVDRKVENGKITLRLGAAAAYAGGSFATIAHELSHTLGAIDIYGTWLGDVRVNQDLTVMGPQPGNMTEVFHHDAWHKMQFGWVPPRVRDIQAPGSEPLRAPQVAYEQAVSDESPIVLYDPRRGTGEFFLLEYRSRTARNAFLPGSTAGSYDADVATTGLAIWQVKQGSDTMPVMVPSEQKPQQPIAGLFNRGAPSWIEGGNRLTTDADGLVELRWPDGTDSGIVLQVGKPSADGASVRVFWGPASPITTVKTRPGSTTLFRIWPDSQVWSKYYPDSRNQWSDWFPLGPNVFPLGATVSAVSTREGGVSLFLMGRDSQVWSKYFPDSRGQWSDWFALGPNVFPVNSVVTALSTRPGGVSLFVLGHDGKVWSRYFPDSRNQWSGWFSIGVNLFPQGTTVTALSTSEGATSLYLVGFDGQVWSNYYPDWRNQWSGWFALGPNVFPQGARVTAVSTARGATSLYVMGLDGQVWSRYWPDARGVWSGWFALGPNVFARTAKITAVSDRPGATSLYVMGLDGQVWSRYFPAANNQWSGWFALGPNVFRKGTEVTAVTQGPNAIGLFTQGLDGRVWNRFFPDTGNVWSPWFPL